MNREPRLKNKNKDLVTRWLLLAVATLAAVNILLWVRPAWLTDRAQAPTANAILTFMAMVELAFASMLLKQWICKHDPYMQRAKRFIEELYSIATGVMALCLVTAAQFLLLTEIVLARPGEIVLKTAKLSLAGKLTWLTIGAFGVLIIMASARTRLARIELALAMDESGERIPIDLELAGPRVKRAMIIGLATVCVLVEFYFVANVFQSNVKLLTY